MGETMAEPIKRMARSAARALGVADPMPYIGGLLDRSFTLPPGDEKYAFNALTPGAVPFEPSFSEREPNALRFTIEPLGPAASPVSRRDEATREMRRLMHPLFGADALRWFDQLSEEWRGFSTASRLHYGAWFGTSYDSDGLTSAKVYYELHPSQIDALPAPLAALVRTVVETMPALTPVFTTISCGRECGSQRVTFLHRGPLRLGDLQPLLVRLGMGHQLPGLMQLVGLTLGGRFDLPERSVLLGLCRTPEGPELKLELLLGRLFDLPSDFLNLLGLGLSERPRELRALSRWLHAFTPSDGEWPGDFSVMSIRTTPKSPARVSLYLRPVELELGGKADSPRVTGGYPA
jgi:hypothetical protein